MDFKQGRRKVKAQTQASPHTTSCIKIMALTLWKSQNSKALTISCDRKTWHSHQSSPLHKLQNNSHKLVNPIN
jgi:hypothetical protein